VARQLYESLGFTNRTAGANGPLMYVYERALGHYGRSRSLAKQGRCRASTTGLASKKLGILMQGCARTNAQICQGAVSRSVLGPERCQLLGTASMIAEYGVGLFLAPPGDSSAGQNVMCRCLATDGSSHSTVRSGPPGDGRTGSASSGAICSRTYPSHKDTKLPSPP